MSKLIRTPYLLHNDCMSASKNNYSHMAFYPTSIFNRFDYEYFDQFAHSYGIQELFEKYPGQFMLNEFPYRTRLATRLYIDIDMRLTGEDHISMIQDMLEWMFEDHSQPDNVLVLQNDISSKLHIILNTRIHKHTFNFIDNTGVRRVVRVPAKQYQKYVLEYIRDTLYEMCLDPDVDQKVWNDAFDINAAGLRSAYSTKVVNGEVWLIDGRPDMYVPWNEPRATTAGEIQQHLAKYSIYAPITGRLRQSELDKINEKIRRDFHVKRKQHEEYLNRCDETTYNTETKELTFDGKTYNITSDFIDTLIAFLPDYHKHRKNWRRLVYNIKAATCLLPDFSPVFLLHRWSVDSPDYDPVRNNQIWERISLDKAAGLDDIEEDELDELEADANSTNRTAGDFSLQEFVNRAINRHQGAKPGIQNIYEIPPQFARVEYESPEVQPYDFEQGKYDTLIIRSPKGTGKTKQLLRYIAKQPASTNIVIVSFRQSFTSALAAKLPEFVDYRSVDKKITAPRVIIQFESLHRLRIDAGQPYILIMDESEAVFAQINNPETVRQYTLGACWLNFWYLLTAAEQVLALDANATIRTYHLLAEARPPPAEGAQNICLHLNTWREQRKNDYLYTNEQHWREQLTIDDFLMCDQMLARVRDIPGGQHIFIKYMGACWRPTTYDSVARTHGCINRFVEPTDNSQFFFTTLLTMPVEQEFHIGHRMYWKAHLYNKLITNISREDFLYQFIQVRIADGAKITVVDEEPAEKKKQGKVLKYSPVQIAAIVSVPVITPEEARTIAEKKCGRTPTQSAALTRYDLMTTFRVKTEAITPEFVGIFTQQSIRDVWFHMLMLEGREDMREAVIGSLQDFPLLLGMYEHVDDLSEEKRYERQQEHAKRIAIGVDILRALFAGRSINLLKPGVQAVKVKRTEFEKRLQEVVGHLVQDMPVLTSLFKFTSTCNTRLSFWQQLAFVNMILVQVFDVKIKAVNSGRREFHVEPSALYRFHEHQLCVTERVQAV